MKSEILAAMAILALVGTVGTVYAFESRTVSEKVAEDEVSETRLEDSKVNCRTYRFQHEPQYQHNGSKENETQDQHRNQHRNEYQINRTCDDATQNESRNQWNHEWNNLNDRDCDQNQDGERNRNYDHYRNGPGGP